MNTNAANLVRRGSGLLFVIVAVVASWGASAGDRLPPGASSCSGCHAAPQAGDGTAPVDLATLSPEQIAAALAAYRSGERQGTIMPRLAKGYSEAESRAIAAALGRPER